MSDKISSQHLEHAAYVYIRQSTLRQVRNNLESSRRQYALEDRARALGFKSVAVIDDDLGISGTGSLERPGFAKLLAAVCNGEARGVFALETSRLARHNRDWHPLFGRELEVLGGAGGKRDVVYVMLPDRTTRSVPGWIFEEVICLTVRLAQRPTMEGGVLLRLAHLLDLSLECLRTGDDENKSCFQTEATSLSTANASSPAVGICGETPTNPGPEPDKVRAVAARATGERRSSDQLQPRRQR